MNTKSGLYEKKKKTCWVTTNSWRVICEEEPHAINPGDSRGNIWCSVGWLYLCESPIFVSIYPLWLDYLLLDSFLSQFLDASFLHKNSILSAPPHSPSTAPPKKTVLTWWRRLVPRDVTLVKVTLFSCIILSLYMICPFSRQWERRGCSSPRKEVSAGRWGRAVKRQQDFCKWLLQSWSLLMTYDSIWPLSKWVTLV